MGTIEHAVAPFQDLQSQSLRTRYYLGTLQSRQASKPCLQYPEETGGNTHPFPASTIPPEFHVLNSIIFPGEPPAFDTTFLFIKSQFSRRTPARCDANSAVFGQLRFYPPSLQIRRQDDRSRTIWRSTDGCWCAQLGHSLWMAKAMICGRHKNRHW